MPSKCFNLNRIINLPKEISISCINDKHLVIAPKKGTYIVLDNIQLEFLKFLMKGNTLKELVNSRHYNKELYPKLQDLLIQFEVRKFYESYQPKQKIKLSARLYLTNECNLRCTHCYRYSENEGNYNLNIFDWKKILKELRENGIQDISLSGGEPFIFDGIYDLIDYAVDKCHMNVTILSNGTEIDFNNISTLKKLRQIQLSIDGPNEKINDKIRGEGVYCKVMESLDKLYFNGIPLTISMVLFEKFLKEYELSLESFINKINTKYNNLIKINFATGILPGRKVNIDNNTYFYHQKLQNFMYDVYKNVYDRKGIIQPKIDFTSLKFRTNCGYSKILTIDQTGQIYACSLPYYSVGNIRKNSINDIILKLNDLNKKFSVDKSEPCFKCDIRYICGGLCRVMHNYLYDNMHEMKCGSKYNRELKRLFVEMYPSTYTIEGVKDGKEEYSEQRGK